MSETPTTLGQRAKQARENLGLRTGHEVTQVVAADAIGVTRSYVTNIELGNDTPGLGTLIAMAGYYDVSLEWLALGTGEMRPSGSAAARDEREMLWLGAFRELPRDESDALLKLVLSRVRPPGAN